MLHLLLEDRLRQAVLTRVPDADPAAIRIRPCPDPRFGDYQTSALIGLAKSRGGNPRTLAQEVLGSLNVADVAAPPELAGAGFINFRVRPEAVARVLDEAAHGVHLFFRPAETPVTVVLDFSSPNVAKPMHVGHIRSTILGDCLARVLRRLGHRVVTDNHLGDWGTQFGKLLVGWKTQLDSAALARDPIGEMERLYKLINAACDSDPATLEAARLELVKLQAGDSENLALWRQMIALSQKEFDAIYSRLAVRFDHTLGESFYNPQLKNVVRELADRGIARESEGALVVFFEDHPELAPHPAIVRKKDGAANYTTTDLATLAYRIRTWHPGLIVYVTDGRQQLHFRQVFEAFRRWHPDSRGVQLAHVWFGSILGDDGKPFKARSGDVVRLADLLDEAEERALRIVIEKNPDLARAEQRAIARRVGIGAVKYADLLPNRQSDYIFSWDKMLALNGNTAPYLQYAYARIRSIFRKLPGTPGSDSPGHPSVPLALAAPEEVRLGKHLLNFGLVIETVAAEFRPNYLCNYLYDLAGHFTAFYEHCPVLKAPEPERTSRLTLCDLTARVLEQGLGLLGIEVIDRM